MRPSEKTTATTPMAYLPVTTLNHSPHHRFKTSAATKEVNTDK